LFNFHHQLVGGTGGENNFHRRPVFYFYHQWPMVKMIFTTGFSETGSENSGTENGLCSSG
jgi:hypothetical protein